MILSALSVGDIRQYDLLPLAFSKSLSEKLYQGGRITLLEPLPEDILAAELNIVVLPVQTQARDFRRTADEQPESMSSEQDFKALGLSAFFSETDDADVDWEDCCCGSSLHRCEITPTNHGSG